MSTWTCPFVQVDDAPRPFRLWDARRKKHLPGRNYGTEVAAINGAVILIYWAHIGDTIEVVDVTTARLVKQFTRKVNSHVEYTPKRHLRRVA